ncbi:acyl carrier protein [Streptomyces sp. BH097]|uniref:acyl carrier protein n=1 Tax=unclassified Streptomyces TaxID=2593676 RepID=UPI003BB69159
MSTMAIEDLGRLLTEEAGETEAGALTDASADTEFTALGYDSLALLGIAARIAKEFGVEIPDDVLFELHTPRAVLDLVNGAVVERG